MLLDALQLFGGRVGTVDLQDLTGDTSGDTVRLLSTLEAPLIALACPGARCNLSPPKSMKEYKVKHPPHHAIVLACPLSVSQAGIYEGGKGQAAPHWWMISLLLHFLLGTLSSEVHGRTIQLTPVYYGLRSGAMELDYRVCLVMTMVGASSTRP